MVTQTVSSDQNPEIECWCG